MTATFIRLADPAAVAEAAADRVVAILRNAISRRGVARVAISGGGTPRLAYPLLTRPPRVDAVDWSKVEFFWADERTVPPDHPDSNFGSAWMGWLSQLPGLRQGAVHRMPAEGPDLDAAAAAYQAEVARAFGVSPDAAADPATPPPVLDLAWLGLGRDGHTASLFPGSSALGVADRWVAGTWAPGPACWRMTLTFPLLNAAREVLFTATGADKADALRRVRMGDPSAAAGQIHAGRVTFLVDEAADPPPPISPPPAADPGAAA